MSDEWEAQKLKIVASLREALHFFSNENKLEREKYLVRQLLEVSEIDFKDEELREADEPVDIAFRNCNFQVKEILNKGRRRYDEFKVALDKAQKAQGWDELLEPYSPRDLPLSEIVGLTLERSQILANRKYGPNEVAALDLLCYCNFNDVYETECAFDLPKESPFRSISVVSNRFRIVIYANDAAPEILARSVGALRVGLHQGGV